MFLVGGELLGVAVRIQIRASEAAEELRAFRVGGVWRGGGRGGGLKVQDRHHTVQPQSGARLEGE